MKKALLYFVLIFVVIMMVSCGGVSGVDSGDYISSQGGTVKITCIESPIYGTEVVIPENALNEGERLQLAITYDDEIPVVVDQSSKRSVEMLDHGKYIQFVTNKKDAFNELIQITLPLNKELMEQDYLPLPHYWQPEKQEYMPLTVTDISTETNTVTVIGNGFENMVVFYEKTQDLLSEVRGDYEKIERSGFKFDEDSFSFRNTVTPRNNEGCCYGISWFTKFYYDELKYLENDHLNNAYGIIPRIFRDSNKIIIDSNLNDIVEYDLNSIEIATQMQSSLNKNLFSILNTLGNIYNRGVFYANFVSMLKILDQGSPVVLNFLALKKNPSFLGIVKADDIIGHAVLAYDYETETTLGIFKKYKIYCYDSNSGNQEPLIIEMSINSFPFEFGVNEDYDIFKVFPDFSQIIKVNRFENLYNSSRSNQWKRRDTALFTIINPQKNNSDVYLLDYNQTDGYKFSLYLEYDTNTKYINYFDYIDIYYRHNTNQDWVKHETKSAKSQSRGTTDFLMPDMPSGTQLQVMLRAYTPSSPIDLEAGGTSFWVRYEGGPAPNQKPTVSINVGPTGNIYTDSSTFNWSGSDSDGSISHYLYNLDNSGWSTTNNTSYTWSGYFYGSHIFSVKAVDNKGLESDPVSRSFTYGTGLSIATQPQSQSKTVGQSVTFSVTASGGSSPYYYQWRKNGVNIPGANSSSYAKSNLQTSDAGQYSVVVTDSANNSVNSNSAQLTVGDTLKILSHPGDANKSVGQSVTFTVVVSGGITPYHYQWKKDGVNIAGANSDTYVRYDLQTGDSGQYSVYVTDSANPQNGLQSNSGNLVVTNPTPEPGDNEVIVFMDYDFGGAYQRLVIEGYYEPEAIGLPNDSISSLKIGKNVKAVLYKDTRYNGDRIRYPTDENNDHNIERIEHSFDDQISSIVVMDKSTSDDFKPPIGSDDPDDQVILYEGSNFSGNHSTLTIGHYRNSAEFGISNDSLSSLKIGKNVKIRVYKHNDFQGDWHDYPRVEDWDYEIENIEHAFNDEVSSLKIAWKDGSLDE